MWKTLAALVFVTLGLISPSKSLLCKDQRPICNRNSPYRTIDGTCNNLEHPEWAAAITPYGRLLENTYGDGLSTWPVSSSGTPLPYARDVSNILNPAAVNLDQHYTLGLMQYGQIVAHDLSFTGFVDDLGLGFLRSICCSGGKPGPHANQGKCRNIEYPPYDPVFQDNGMECFNFERTATTYDAGCTSAGEIAEPINVVSGYFDLSVLYGATDDVADSIRSFSKGRINVQHKSGQTFPQQAPNASFSCSLPNEDDICYRGDVRMNQNAQLTVLQIAYIREHNNLADALAAINPHWTDEELYQEARRISIAKYQHLVYNEFIPRILGKTYTEQNKITYPGNQGCVYDYDPTVDASPLVESASGALRGLHSQISGNLELVNEQREVLGALRLISHMRDPSILDSSNYTGECDINYDYLARGMSYQPAQTADKTFDPDTKLFIFRANDKYGVDIRAQDIQRERDHGVGTYVNARKLCNLSVPKSFDDLYDILPAEDVEALRSLYSDVNDIELTAAGLLEPPVPEALVGPTFQCIIGIEVYKARVGDRFFYENCGIGSHTPEQMVEIRKASFACLLCETSYCVNRMQPHAFDLISDKNAVTSCEELCPVDLSSWKEDPVRTTQRRKSQLKKW